MRLLILEVLEIKENRLQSYIEIDFNTEAYLESFRL